MTPSDIARMAAEHIRLNNEMTEGGYDTPHTTELIILSAAAKMVRESGAVEALESCGEAVYRGDTYQYFDEAKAKAALQSLRSLTEHKG